MMAGCEVVLEADGPAAETYFRDRCDLRGWAVSRVRRLPGGLLEVGVVGPKAREFRAGLLGDPAISFADNGRQGRLP